MSDHPAAAAQNTIQFGPFQCPFESTRALKRGEALDSTNPWSRVAPESGTTVETQSASYVHVRISGKTWTSLINGKRYSNEQGKNGKGKDYYWM